MISKLFRDAGIIAIGHFVWSILGVIFVFSLLGVSHNTQSINIDQLRSNTGSWVSYNETSKCFAM
jgi:hypothetical protein